MWKPRKIANPDYFVDKTPLKNLGDVGGVAIEIWTMDEGYFFDNVLVGSDADEAEKYRVSEWAPKKDIEVRLEACAHGLSVHCGLGAQCAFSQHVMAHTVSKHLSTGVELPFTAATCMLLPG